MSIETEVTPAAGHKISILETPLLSAGREMTLLGSAEQLWMHVKVYAEGGENGLHAHFDEDHAFFVLGGEATFTAGDGSKTVVGPYEGMFLPRGAQYCFRSTGAENLVMLRAGGGDRAKRRRQSPDGSPIKSAAAPVRSGEVLMNTLGR